MSSGRHGADGRDGSRAVVGAARRGAVEGASRVHVHVEAHLALGETPAVDDGGRTVGGHKTSLLKSLRLADRRESFLRRRRVLRAKTYFSSILKHLQILVGITFHKMFKIKNTDSCEFVSTFVFHFSVGALGTRAGEHGDVLLRGPRGLIATFPRRDAA